MSDKFVVADDVFFANKTDFALFYNVTSRTKVLLDKRDSEVASFCDALAVPESLLTAKCPDHYKESEIFSELLDLDMGRIVNSLEKDCAIPLVPIINRDLDFMPDEEERRSDIEKRNLLSYLNCITFYIGGGHCGDNNLCLQTYYPFKADSELSLELVYRTIKECEVFSNDYVYNIILSHLDNKCLEYLIREFGVYKNSIYFYLLSNNDNYPYADYLFSLGFNVTLIIDSIIKDSLNTNFSGSVNLIIRNRQDALLYEDLMESGMRVSPILVYDNNLDFLKEYCFLNDEDLKQLNCSKQELFIHQKINIYNWGNLYVHPDASVYSSSLANHKVGCLGKNTIKEMIAEELLRNYAWRKTRNNPQCIDCIYQWLCPTPSAIEALAGTTSCYRI